MSWLAAWPGHHPLQAHLTEGVYDDEQSDRKDGGPARVMPPVLYFLVDIDGGVPASDHEDREEQTADDRLPFPPIPPKVNHSLVIGKVPGWWPSTATNPHAEKPMRITYSISPMAT